MAKIALSEAPASGTKVVIVEGKRILLCRSAAGIHAMDETCPHQAMSLEGGSEGRRSFARIMERASILKMVDPCRR